MITRFSQKQDPYLSDSMIILLLSAFFVRFIPAILFFGSSEITESLRYFEFIEPRGIPASNLLSGLPPPFIPFIQALFPLHYLAGLPLVFLLKMPGIIADIAITFMIHLMVYQASQDRKKAFYSGLLYALNPASIIVTSFTGSPVSMGIAFFLASLCFCFIFRNLALTAFFLGTAIALEHLYFIFIPVFLLKAGRGWFARMFFFTLSFLTLFLWYLPGLMKGTGFSVPAGSIQNFSNEPLFGFSAALKTLLSQKTSLPFSTLIENFFSLCMSFYLKYSHWFLLTGLTLLYAFHKRQNPYVLTMNAMLFASAIAPGLYPFQLAWILPLALIMLQRSTRYYTLALSLFFAGWYSIMAVDSGTFCAVNFLNHSLSNVSLHQQNWVHWLFFITANLVVPAILWLILSMSVFHKSKAMDRHTAKKIKKAPLTLISATIGILITNIGISAFTPPTSPMESEINYSAFHASRYGENFYFRNVMTMNPEVERALIKVSSEDFFIIYLNGKMVYCNYGDRFWYRHGGKEKKMNSAVPVDITPYLRTGKNVIGIETIVASVRPAAGLALIWELKGEALKNFSLPFLKGWKAKPYPSDPGWMLSAFDDSGWKAPVIVKQSNVNRIMHFPWKPVSGKNTLYFPIPPAPKEFFFLSPREYSPPDSSVTATHILITYSLIFFLFQFFVGRLIQSSYAFFGKGASS